jgi:hypothetical protein
MRSNPSTYAFSVSKNSMTIFRRLISRASSVLDRSASFLLLLRAPISRDPGRPFFPTTAARLYDDGLWDKLTSPVSTSSETMLDAECRCEGARGAGPAGREMRRNGRCWARDGGFGGTLGIERFDRQEDLTSELGKYTNDGDVADSGMLLCEQMCLGDVEA